MDAEFFQIVEELRMPIMGAEILAPLLYTLVRFTRPRRVLEVGAGYTTPFIARALADNAADYERDVGPLAIKSREFVRALSKAPAPDAGQREAWIGAEPVLASPRFYAASYKPALVSVDSLAVAGSSASRVSDVIDRLGLRSLVTMIHGDFRAERQSLVRQCAPIDFAWVDCNQCLAFFEQYWRDINPGDGLVLFHSLLTDGNGEVVLEYFKSKQRVRNDFEIVSLWEPHKLAQNSITILRKTARKNPVFDDNAVLVSDTQEFLKTSAPG